MYSDGEDVGVPCPFCGAPSLMQSGEERFNASQYHWVNCSGRNSCEASGPIDTSQEGAILRWASVGRREGSDHG